MGISRDQISVREAVEADKAAWADMRFDLWGRLTVEDHLADISDVVTSEKRFGYIAAFDEGEPVGFAEISIRDYANGCTSQPVPFLEGIWVKPAYRRQDVGRLLLEKISDDFLDKGFSERCSDVDIENRKAQAAHGGWSFEETERVVYFRKSLKEEE